MNVGFSSDIGQRQSFEDTHVILKPFGGYKDKSFFAIYDGHGGKEASEMASKLLHTILLAAIKKCKDIPDALDKAFIETDKQIEEAGIESGTTAVVALIEGQNLFVANAGDSRAVLDRGELGVRRLSHDHKADDPDEAKRVEALGGWVSPATEGFDVARVNGIIAIARSLGDKELGEFVSAKPYISETKLTKGDKRLILACDGVWDVMTDEDAVGLISKVADPQKASEILKNEALRRGSTDNISVMAIEVGLLTYI